MSIISNVMGFRSDLLYKDAQAYFKYKHSLILVPERERERESE